jgi:hypothetical protein
MRGVQLEQSQRGSRGCLSLLAPMFSIRPSSSSHRREAKREDKDKEPLRPAHFRRSLSPRPNQIIAPIARTTARLIQKATGFFHPPEARTASAKRVIHPPNPEIAGPPRGRPALRSRTAYAARRTATATPRAMTPQPARMRPPNAGPWDGSRQRGSATSPHTKPTATTKAETRTLAITLPCSNSDPATATQKHSTPMPANRGSFARSRQPHGCSSIGTDTASVCPRTRTSELLMSGPLPDLALPLLQGRHVPFSGRPRNAVVRQPDPMS